MNDQINTPQIVTEPSATAKKQTPSKFSQSETESKAKEINGPKGLEPTRYGDWESKGRCHDF